MGKEKRCAGRFRELNILLGRLKRSDHEKISFLSGKGEKVCRGRHMVKIVFTKRGKGRMRTEGRRATLGL